MLSSSQNADPTAAVIDVAGQRAAIVSTEHAKGEECAWLRLDDGMQLLVPVAMLTRLDDGSYRLPISFDAAREQAHNVQISMPVMEERFEVGKRKVDTGRGVRIRKTVSERESLIDEPLQRDEFAVERIPVGQIMENAPQMRYEGDTLVVPVLEEVLVVEKRLLLKEEIRITRHRHEVHEPQRVSLRTEHVEVERFDERAQLMPTQSDPSRNGSGRSAG